ncbi:hypothetical protein TNCV_2466041 [Trichonephila clavipes]|nr:hypothetical protein TNCV_2466041 [Trichonephila clavipes]
MYKDTKNFVRSCTICLSRKNAFKIPPAPHQPVEQSQELGETCHIDIFGPLKTTPKGSMEPQHSALTGTHRITEFSTHCGQITDFLDVLPHMITEFSSRRGEMGTIATYLDMSAVSVLVHYWDFIRCFRSRLHSSENEAKYGISLFHSPTRPVMEKLHMKKVLFFSLKTAAGQFPGSTWSST